MRFLRMKPGHGEVLIAEGDVDLAEDERMLIEEFRRQLDSGSWAAVPITSEQGRRNSIMVRSFDDIPRDADRVIFFPRAAGGR
ncbi:MAG TPA: hypothetical protein VH279_12410 [Solirubrobacteraceae bacterium]|nr:hypothetical protein [Solirubrobacteraceae bacterium]